MDMIQGYCLLYGHCLTSKTMGDVYVKFVVIAHEMSSTPRAL